MVSNKFIDVDYTESNDKKRYYTIDEVSEKLKVEIGKIIFWCNKFGELLHIESIGMYKIFDDNDIKNLKLIRKLNLYENMNISDIKEYFKTHTEVLIQKEKSQVDISVFNVFANIITAQNDKLNEINNNYNEMIKKQDKALELFLKVHEEISLDRDKQKEYTENLENQIRELNNQIEVQNELTVSKLNEIDETINSKIDQLEANATARDIDLISKLQSKLDEHKQSYEEESTVKEEKKGFFSKLFK